MRLGILGGTFDPPHNGHLLVARAAHTTLALDRVLFAPAGVQPLKQGRLLTPPEARAEMVALAIADFPGFELSRIDLDRPGPHYTVDLLRIASGLFPGADTWFIMGNDSLSDLLRWRDPRGILEQARLAVVRRPGASPDWDALESALPDLRARLDWIDAPLTDVTGHDIRRRVRQGLGIDGMVPPIVAQYIVDRRLYV